MKEIKIKENLLIGLEIHITINSKKKIFSKVDTFLDENEKANTLISPWELGYPGVLPILNIEVVKKAIFLAKSFNMKIENEIKFDRKIYQYFDLPKGYQITQYSKPIANNGIMRIINNNKKTKKIKIKSIHLEEDTAKSIYIGEKILLDFNRAGNPLIELVTDPIFNKINEIEEFINNLCFYLRYLDISDAKMEKGRMRIDANFSVKFTEFNKEDKIREWNSPRYELKNFNSLKKIEKAMKKTIISLKKEFIKSDEKRKINEDLTLSFNEKEDIIKINRKKEKYLYFPEINIPILKIDNEEIKSIINNRLFPWYTWEKMKKNNEIENIDHYFFLKNIILAKFFDFIDKKDEKTKKNKFFKFYLDYLFPYFKENEIKNEMNFEKIKKEWKFIIKLLKEWDEEKKNKEEIRKEIHNLLIEKKEKIERLELIEEKEIVRDLWYNLKEKLIIEKEKGKRIKNFFLGEIRKRIGIISKSIIEEVDKIIKENE